MFTPIQRNVLIMVGVGSAAIIVNLYVRRKALLSMLQNNNINEEENDKCYSHIMSKTIPATSCYSCVANSRICCRNNVCSYTIMAKLGELVATAKKTVSLFYINMLCLNECVYNELFLAYKRGVHVRIITDYKSARFYNSNDVLNIFKCTKMNVKHQAQALEMGKMECNFCVIDEQDPEEGKLFHSYLLDERAHVEFENAVFTNDPRAINDYMFDFEHLWRYAAFVVNRHNLHLFNYTYERR